MQATTRREARELGLKHFFPKSPCCRGHVCARLTSNKICLECHRERRAKTRAEKPELIRAQKAASYRRNRETTLAKGKAYTAKNKAKIRVRRKAFREANKERLAAAMALWSKANRDILRIHERKRRARKKGAEGSHTLAEIRDLEIRQKLRCVNCGVSLRGGYHVDHIMPLARGGTNSIRNIQLLCAACNHSKHAHDPIEWAQMQGRLI